MTKNSITSITNGLTKSFLHQELFDEALKLATAGASMSEVSRHVTAKADQETAAMVFDAVLEYFRALAEFNPAVELGKANARLSMIFHNSLKIMDYKTALATQKEINRLLQLGKTEESAAIDIDSLL